MRKSLYAAALLAALTATPALAQVGTGTTPGATQTTQDDDGFDWGWLGLLGLAGLAGLAGRKRNDTTINRR
jgi:hypothetical protein